MAKILCKSVRKDGSPCRGQALKQFDGYCIAHGPTDKTRAWRARGGKNSATAVRADKRIPERLQTILNELDEGFAAVRAGTLSPAAYTAMCRGAKAMTDVYRLAQEEMKEIRNEESQAAAAQIADERGDLDILKAADAITAEHDQYRIDALIAQGLAAPKRPDWKNRPQQFILTGAGQKRFFGYRRWSSYTQADIDEYEQAVEEKPFDRCDLPHEIACLTAIRAEMETSLTDLARLPVSEFVCDPTPPPDPLSGQLLTEPPAGVQSGRPDSDDDDLVPDSHEQAAEILHERIDQVDKLIRGFEEDYADTKYDYKRYVERGGSTVSEDGKAELANVKVEHFGPPFNLRLTKTYWDNKGKK